MIGRDTPNKIITNFFGISDTASSAVFTESSDVTLIWKIMVGMNQTQFYNEPIESPFNDSSFFDHFKIIVP